MSWGGSMKCVQRFMKGEFIPPIRRVSDDKGLEMVHGSSHKSSKRTAKWVFVPKTKWKEQRK